MNIFLHGYCEVNFYFFFPSLSGLQEVTVRRNAGPRCPSTSSPGPWQLHCQWQKRGASMASPALLDGRHPPWCSYGCLWCCYGCRGLPKLNNWPAGDRVERRFMVPCRPQHRRRHRHPPPPPRPRPAPQLGASTHGRVGGSWTGCCQRKDLFTNARSTRSSERGSSKGFLQDTRFTGERGCSYVWQNALTIWKIKRWSREWHSALNLSVGFCVSLFKELLTHHFDLWSLDMKDIH